MFYTEDNPQVPRFVRERVPELRLSVNSATPLGIRGEYLLLLGVQDVDGKFDADNYAVVLKSRRIHRFGSKPLFGIRRADGREEMTENAERIERVLDREEYERLKTRIYELFKAARPTASLGS